MRALLLLLLAAVAAAEHKCHAGAKRCERAHSHTWRRDSHRPRVRSPAAALALRGGATIGPLRIGPFSLEPGPRTLVYLNVFAGLMYSLSLVGLLEPDPTLKYWQHPQTPATRAILQFFALALGWINGFMLYALFFMKAPATGLLKFQSFGWASVLALMAFQSSRYGFTVQHDSLGVQITLGLLSAYLGFAP